MKYYIKSAKGYWLAQGNGYTKTKAKPMLSLSTKCCSLLSIWTAARSSDNPKHSQGVLTTLCYAKSLVSIKL